MRSFLFVLLLPGCLMGPYETKDWDAARENPELRRGAERVVLCDNGGFVADLGGVRSVGNRAALDSGRRHVGALPSGEHAFNFAEDFISEIWSSPVLGGDWVLEKERWDETEQAAVLTACTMLEDQPWLGVVNQLPQPLAVQKLVFPYATLEECIADPQTPPAFDPDEYCHDRLVLCPDGSYQASGGYPGANDIARYADRYTNVFGELSWSDTGGFGAMAGVYRDGTLTTSTYRDWQLEMRWDAVSPSAIGFACP